MSDSALINWRDLEFLLFELFDADALTQRPRFADHSRETFVAALDTAHAIALEKFAPHNRASDEHEPQFDGERVTVIPEVAAALRAYGEAGFIAAGKDYELGGMQLPALIAQACLALFKSANAATASYPMLTSANANVIDRFGTPEQKRKYLRPLLEGRFFGTMALTEPQAGSSLADITTRAVPNPDGTYSLSGNKIFISGGDHELTENIVHLVLAKIPGGPPGVQGISLFIVPKYRVNDDGSLGERNDVALAGLIHKMGWRGTTSTMLSFGERGACIGELVGEPHRGLSYMFQMMNEARIGVGMGAAMLGYRGYLASLQYAREREQGRLPGERRAEAAPVALIAHADVRRMLIAQKAYVEGGLALCLYAARLVDDQRTAGDDATRQSAALLLDLLTPVVKSWPSQWCLEANSLAIQIHGGYGYTREYPVEQFYRDNRLNMIHEGTHGIQALDLLGRKIRQHDGQALELLSREIDATIGAAREHADLGEEADALDAAQRELRSTLAVLLPALRDRPEAALALAPNFLETFGHIVVAWLWLRQAVAASRGLPQAQAGDAAFYRGKIQACRWFFRHELPKVQVHHALMRAVDETVLGMQAEWF